jgi:hypothetical protein
VERLVLFFSKEKKNMSKKVYNLVVGIIGGVSTIAVAVVTFIAPPYAVAINASIGIASTAAIEICGQFVKA